MPADGSGAAERLTTNQTGTPASWSPDGQVLAFQSKGDIWMLPLEGEPQPFIQSPFNETCPTFSPDGRRFLMVQEVSRPGREPVTEIRIVLNWFEELKRLVPTKN